MKRFIAVSLTALMMITNVYAGDISVKLNNDNVEFSNQQPVIVEGRTLIPLRGVFEKLGYEITWDSESKTAVFTDGENTVEISVDASTFTVNGEEKALDVPAQIINGSMMLPLRAVGEAAGLEVNWDAESKTVNLSEAGNENLNTTAAESSTETTTAEAVNQGVDEKAVKDAAKAYGDYLAITFIMDDYQIIDWYNSQKINAGIMYSNPVKELEASFDVAIEECRNFKSALSRLDVGSAGKDSYNALNGLIDACISDYLVMKDCYCTDKYDNLSDTEVRKKLDASLSEVNKSIVNFEMNIAAFELTIREIGDNENYNPYFDDLNEEELSAAENYYKEIAKVVNSSMEFVNDETAGIETAGNFASAVRNIRAKLDSTEAPEFCKFDREMIRVACDLLESAGDAVKGGALTDPDYSAEFITLKYALITSDMIFAVHLQDNYTSKFFDMGEAESDDITEVPELPEFEDGSKLV